MCNKVVAYYRVSTQKQGSSGLGLDAQREAVRNYLRSSHKQEELLNEYIEIESGKSDLNRPELQKAIRHCKDTGAMLIIAKLDRLARDVEFVAGLMKSDLSFKALDIPEANKLTIHIMVAMAEFERERISDRIKEALKQAKGRGAILGTPKNLDKESAEKGRELGRKSIKDKADTFATDKYPQIKELLDSGLSLRAVARELNQRGTLTPSGKQGKWTPTTVKNIINRFEKSTFK